MADINRTSMRISGFSMVRNADKLFFPVKESILSILPLVDEFVIALGDCDADDKTRELIESINDPKIKIIDTVWDLIKFPHGTEYAHQTDIAKSYCTGNWLFYLQADEVIHENDLPAIKAACARFLSDTMVEGFVFNYKHFWGDFNHYHQSHGWYPREIRIIRNHPDIHSWGDAQSFRKIPGFDGKSYRGAQNASKLKVVSLDASVFHYGWVRPLSLMRKKTKSTETIYKGSDKLEEIEKKVNEFDYGPLNLLKIFNGQHPLVMQAWIDKFDWKHELQYTGSPNSTRRPHRHETLKNRIFSFIKYKLLNMPTLGEFNNFILLNR